MSFLHFSMFLWALPLALLPIALHLLTLQRLRTVELSTYRFLFDSYVQQRRRMQFLEALLAFLRMLFLLLVIAALGRPAVKQFDQLFGSGASGREVFLLVDCSASMGAVSQGKTALERAQTVAKTILTRLQPDDRVTLLRVTSKPEEVFGRRTRNDDSLDRKIDGLTVGPTRANFFAALVYLFGVEAKPGPSPLLYVFTDAQASGWKEVKAPGVERIMPKDTPVTLVQVGADEPGANLAILGDAPRRERAVVGLPVMLEARATNLSKTETVEATLKFVIDNQEYKSFPVALKPGEVLVKREAYEPAKPGTHQCRFEIAAKLGDKPDPFPDDNHFEFALDVAPRIGVLIVNGNPTANPLDDETLYLRVALSTTDDPTDDDPKKKNPLAGKEVARSLDVRTVPEIGLTQQLLAEASVVILANCGQLNATHFLWLREYVSGGGGLLIFPGDKVQPLVYNTQFFPVPGPLKESVTAATFGDKPEGDLANADTYEYWPASTIAFDHRVLSVFKATEAQYFRDVRFKQRWPLRLPNEAAAGPPKPPVGQPAPPVTAPKPTTGPTRVNAQVLARFGTNAPALIESKLGDGVVLLAAFPANAVWTNFPSRCAKEFVPLILRMVAHVQRRADVDAPLQVLPGGVGEFSVANTWAPAKGKVIDPDGVDTELTFERGPSRWSAAFEGTRLRGFYKVAVQGARPEQRRPDLAFAVNLAPEESDGNRLSEAQFKELLPSAAVTLLDASPEKWQELSAPKPPKTEFWKPLVWLVFVVIGAEFLLSTFGGSRRRGAGEDEPTSGARVAAYNQGSLISRMTGGA